MQKFIIKSVDSYNEKSFQKVSGTKEVFDTYVKYSYDSNLGMCEIIKTNSEIHVKRIGKNKSVIEVSLGKTTDFYYKNEVMEKMFKVKGTHISYDNDKKILNFIYKIYDLGEELNEINFSIKEL